MGDSRKGDVSIIGEIVEDSPAHVAGIVPGDQILSIGGSEVSSWVEMVAAIESNPGREVPLAIDRNGERLTLLATPRDSNGGHPNRSRSLRFSQ